MVKHRVAPDDMPDLAEVQDRVKKLVEDGQPIPDELIDRMLWTAVTGLAGKEKVSAIATIRKMRKDSTVTFTLADVPKEALQSIAKLRAKGLVPYSPRME